MQGPVAILRHIGGLSFDAVFTETHTATMEVTDNPIENGSVVSDHAFMKPLTVTIEAGVSDAVLRPNAADMYGSGASRAKAAFDMLCDLQKTREPFEVQTGLKLYSNMVCTSIRTEQNKDLAGAFVFVADLREVIIVNTLTVKYPPRKSGSTKNQADAKANKGEQQGTKVDGSTSAADKPKQTSVLKKAFTAVNGGSN